MSLKVKNKQFIKSAPKFEQLPQTQFLEFAFIGRSNVGKSSMINAILESNIAKTSNTPGKTTMFNVYQVNDNLYLIDLPGYGYAKRSKSERAHWENEFEKYLKNRDKLGAICMIIDSSIKPQESDLLMLENLINYKIPILIVLNKADKIKQNELSTALRFWTNLTASIPNINVITFSSKTKKNPNIIWDNLFELTK
jgi:GTP-binding protein